MEDVLGANAFTEWHPMKKAVNWQAISDDPRREYRRVDGDGINGGSSRCRASGAKERGGRHWQQVE